MYLSFSAYKAKTFKLRQIILLHGLCIFSGSITILLNYSATRAYYGASLFMLSFLALLMIMNLKSSKKKSLGVIPLVVAFVIFTTHMGLIMNIKSKNTQTLANIEHHLIENIKACSEPCRIELKKLDEGIKRDWVIPKDFWKSYALWVQRKILPRKKITYIVL